MITIKCDFCEKDLTKRFTCHYIPIVVGGIKEMATALHCCNECLTKYKFLSVLTVDVNGFAETQEIAGHLTKVMKDAPTYGVPYKGGQLITYHCQDCRRELATVAAYLCTDDNIRCPDCHNTWWEKVRSRELSPDPITRKP